MSTSKQNVLLNMIKTERPYSLFEVSDRVKDMASVALSHLYDEPIIFVKPYAEALNNTNAGLMLSYLVNNTEPQEWMELNPKKCFNDIGLSKKEYELAREILRTYRVVDNKRTVAPTKSFYRVNERVLDKLILEKGKAGISSLTTRPISINRLHLRTITSIRHGNPSVALYLACIQELVPYRPIEERTEFTPWMPVTMEYITERSGLTRGNQESARKFLYENKILESKKEDFPANSYYRISNKVLGDLTAEYIQINS